MGIYAKSLNTLDEGCLYRSDKSKEAKKDKFQISIHMDGDTKRDKGYVEEPYIKVENSPNADKADKELRFSMKTGKIIIHSGKEPMKYNKNLGKLLNEILNRKSTNLNYSNMTVYDAFYEDLKERFPDNEILKFDKPDFTINS